MRSIIVLASVLLVGCGTSGASDRAAFNALNQKIERKERLQMADFSRAHVDQILSASDRTLAVIADGKLWIVNRSGKADWVGTTLSNDEYERIYSSVPDPTP